jgi:uncharacterized membrane protein
MGGDARRQERNMGVLIAGIVLWSVVHFFPALAAPRRRVLIERMGERRYRGMFALLILSSLVLIVLGWRRADPVLVYALPAAVRPVTFVLMYVALALFLSSRQPTDVKRVLRNPQLTGVVVWAGAHLLGNGDTRSLVLFGGLGLWALLEIAAINRRDGPWVRPAPVGVARSLVPFAMAAVAWVVVAFAHPWIAGVRIL